MPHIRQSRGRTLGSLPNCVADSLLSRFPPLGSSYRSSPIRDSEGVQGNALAVSPRRNASERLEQKPKVILSKPTSSKSVESINTRMCKNKQQSNESEKQKDKAIRADIAHDKQRAEQMTALQNILHDQRKLLADKEVIIKDMQIKFQEKEMHYRLLYERECEAHGNTRGHLEALRSHLADAEQNMVLLAMRHGEEMDDASCRHADQLKAVRAEMFAAIAERDKKLARLKLQMADVLKGNSWERQQQLDELSKELSRVQDEADMLRLKMQSLHKKANSKQICEKCGHCTSPRLQPAIK